MYHKFLPFELLLKHKLKVIPQMIPVSSSCSELDSFVLGLLGIFLLPFYLPPSSRVILEFLFGLSRVLQFDEQFFGVLEKLEFWHFLAFFGSFSFWLSLLFLFIVLILLLAPYPSVTDLSRLTKYSNQAFKCRFSVNLTTFLAPRQHYSDKKP